MKGETRKIQFTGNSSYIVSLPKPWVREMGIKSGDQVVITRHGSSSMHISLLGARPEAGNDELSVVADKGDSTASIVRKIISLYLQGAVTIHVMRKNQAFGAAQRAEIKDSVRRTLVGAEIISDSSRGITIQVLVDALALSVVGAFKRMLYLSKSMIADSVTAIRNHDTDLAHEVINADDEVDRFGFYIIRQLKLAVGDEDVLRELGIGNARNCLDYRLVVKSVERSGDHAVAMAHDPLEFGRAISAPLADMLDTMAQRASLALDNACLALFNRDYALAEKTVGATDIARLEKSVLDATSRGKTEEGYRTRRIAEDIRRIYEYASDIAEIVLNMNIDKAISRGSRDASG